MILSCPQHLYMLSLLCLLSTMTGNLNAQTDSVIAEVYATKKFGDSSPKPAGRSGSKEQYQSNNMDTVARGSTITKRQEYLLVEKNWILGIASTLANSSIKLSLAPADFQRPFDATSAELNQGLFLLGLKDDGGYHLTIEYGNLVSRIGTRGSKATECVSFSFTGQNRDDGTHCGNSVSVVSMRIDTNGNGVVILEAGSEGSFVFNEQILTESLKESGLNMHVLKKGHRAEIKGYRVVSIGKVATAATILKIFLDPQINMVYPWYATPLGLGLISAATFTGGYVGVPPFKQWVDCRLGIDCPDVNNSLDEPPGPPARER